MKSVLFSLLIFLAAAPLGVAADSAASPTRFDALTIEGGEPAATLRGRDARLQLLATGHTDDGKVQDLSRDVIWSATPDDVVRVQPNGLVVPIADGTATIKATDGSLQSQTIQVSVTNTGREASISFPHRIVPIFTKLGCNGGGCHGKAAGQNGFKLSLLGFEPREDYEHLVNESRGRRISPAAPDQSLLLLKAIGQSPHGGGQRTDKESHEYRMMRRWIAQGMPYGDPQAPQVVSINVFPRHRRLFAGAHQQLHVLANLSDGSVEDITRAAVYESNDPEMADVDATGLVKLNEMVGDVAVMARYQGHVTVFRSDIPREGNLDDDAFPPPTNLVDQHVFAKLQSLGIPPSPTCDDATFLRRVTLDLAGRLPTLQELESMENDSGDGRRLRVIDRLLKSPDYASYFANKWNTILRNRRTDGALKYSNIAFHSWIRDSLDANKPYDQFVREIVTASGSVASHPPVAWFQQVPDINSRIEDAAQLFLGQRIQCARCHHHPYEKWSRADYAQMAAFFSSVDDKREGDPSDPTFFTKTGDVKARHPKTGQTLAPAGLDAEPVSVSAADDPRVHFADWMTAPDNPFFAKALVNRYWKHFLGRGLVEPEDDLRVTNPPSNPDLMEALAEQLVASDYDLKSLIRTIVTSRTYQLASDANEANLGDRRSYSRYYPKRLQAEVLLDAIDHVTGTNTTFASMPPGTRAVTLPDTGFDSYFLSVFGRPEATTACECERSQEPNLAQNLHLLNSEQMQDKLSSDTGRAASLAADASRPDEAKIRQLFRITLARNPKASELKATLAYVASHPDDRKAYEDVIWSLINSKEFLFNH